MPLPIAPIQPGSIPLIPQISSSSSAPGTFQSALTDAIGRVEQFQQNSESTIAKFLSGEDEEVHKVALATQQAELSLDLFLQVRNKVVSAYQEVMKMQI